MVSPAGLPRTRGDRPGRGDVYREWHEASPHPRGSTQRVAGLDQLVEGFPAPAGIDPRASCTTTWACGLPRTRGDRPGVGARAGLQHPASPHPRGSTRARGGDHRLQRGFPAPAGIDPLHRWQIPTSMRLPRTRGDRPAARNSREALLMASPHPRGSTLAARWLGQDLGGFPAPAGIDPRTTAAPPAASRLPRTRGDRPMALRISAVGIGASPHPRGSTLPVPYPLPTLRGFPAPAGIDPAGR